MKKTVNSVLIYQNLPSGGGYRLYKILLKTLTGMGFSYSLISESTQSKNVKNMIAFYFQIIWLYISSLPKYLFAINRHQYIISFQSWITKAPIFLPFVHKQSIYICNEAPREFYDEKVIHTHSSKELIVNQLLLFPVRFIDFVNTRLAPKLTIVTVSEQAKKLIKKAYGIEAKVIYPGINTRKYGNNVDRASRQLKIISVGAINKLKNQLFIVEAVGLIPKKIRPSLTLIGNGFDNKYLEVIIKRSKELSVDLSVKINISESELIQQYKSSIVFAFAPVNEPFGLVVLEAMRAGLPLILRNDGGGYTEIVNSTNGYLLPMDQLLWAKCIQNLIKNRSLWSRMSKKNYTQSGHHEEVEWAKKLLSLVLPI